MTPKQRKVLDAIRHLTVDGICPSYEEIRIHLGFSSKGEVHRFVHVLGDEGWLTRPGRARSLMLTTPDPIEKMSARGLRALRAHIDRRLAS